MQTSLFLESGRFAVSVDPALGGRVEQWTYAGRTLLSGPEAHPDNWGATYWTSPQSDWGWPPVPEVDHAPYTLEGAATADRVTLVGPVATIGERRFRIEKRFVARPNECIDTEYRIVNVGSAPFAMASWEISRVPAGGLTFFPGGDRVLTPIAPHAELLLDLQEGVFFYDHGRFELGASRKVHADGREGFLAHVLPARANEGRSEGMLFLKLFADSPAERQAPGEGEVEIFANFDGRYVEVEVQGPYDTIAPGASSALVVRTLARALPPELATDRSALVAWVREVAAGARAGL